MPTAVNPSMQVFGLISINGVSTHPSHSLSLKDGVYFCIKCGFKAQFRVNKLSSACSTKRSSYGQGNLQKAKKGTLSTVPSGPSSSGSHCPTLPRRSESLSMEEVSAYNVVVSEVSNVPVPDTITSSDSDAPISPLPRSGGLDSDLPVAGGAESGSSSSE